MVVVDAPLGRRFHEKTYKREALRVCARRGLFSAEGIQPARAENGTMKVINRRGSYQQPPAARQKKAEGKKRKSPCTPYREKGKGKESDRRVLSRNRLSRAGARATAAHGGHAGRVTLPGRTRTREAARHDVPGHLPEPPLPTGPRLGDIRPREIEKTAVRQRQTPL